MSCSQEVLKLISVIVPAYNAEETIESCIKALLNQSFPKKRYEVIVVDDGSTDKTCQVASKYPIRIVKQRHSGPAAARNFGARVARGEILLFTDSDCIPSNNWIKNMVKPLENERIVGVAGTYKTFNKEKIIARFAGYEIEERHTKLRKEKFIDFVGTYSAAYRKKIFKKFGGFDTSFPIASGEDPELSFKISKSGLKLVFQPNAFVYHRHPDNLLKFLKQKFWRGYWRVLLYKKHKEKIFRHSYTPKSLFVEEALTGLTCLLLLFGLFRIVPIFFGLLFFLLIFLLTLPFSFKIFKKDKEVGIISPVIIILRNFSTGLGIVFGLGYVL
jgi:cellulose synthase/poly-beta-1,6-N-acetylglucosamine synthase-like glycosyltransferase